MIPSSRLPKKSTDDILMKKLFLSLSTYSLLGTLASAQEPRLTLEEAAQQFTIVPHEAGESEIPGVTSYAPLMKKVTPSVVSIFSAIKVNVDGDSPLERFFGQSEEEGAEPGQRPMGSGSGVVLSAKGWIVTNSHVVHLPSGELADAITVQLHDRRRFPATIVGVDPKTDLALLKISAENLQPIAIGDSGDVGVGDLVFAIGNPFRVGMTATMGMVSAVRRTGLGINGPGGYESFIQMDAAINPGNSGGALINANGQLIGINTAIYGGRGGNVGIGFAIPTGLMHPVVMALSAEGKVARGFFGLMTKDITEEEAESAGLDGVYGVVVSRVMEESPVAKSGLESGDVIIKCNGVAVETVGDFRLALSLIPPGGRAEFGVRRKKEDKVFNVVALKDPSEVGKGKVFQITGLEGMGFVMKEDQIVVSEVDASARKVGFEKGMALVSINGESATNPKLVEEALRKGVNKIVTTLARQSHTLALRIK